MARYILIDSNSGYIWGDSADLDGKIFEGNAIQFARALDAWIGTDPNEQDYELLNRPPCDTETGCHVYRADVDGSEAVPVITNGQSQEQIRAVERDCQYEGFISITKRSDDTDENDKNDQDMLNWLHDRRS